MNSNRLLSTMMAALLIAATVAFTHAPVQGATTQVSTEVVRACAGAERSIPENSLKGATACAMALEASLNASDADLNALKAAKGPNAVNVKRMLIKHGLTMQQLEGAEIRFAKIEMDYPARIKIRVTCCPWTIIISW